MNDTATLQIPGHWGGPSTVVAVPIRNEYGERWLAYYEGRWRQVHIQVRRLYIVYRGKRLTIGIEGV